MTLYGGIDLHSNNAVISILDSQNRPVSDTRLANKLPTIQGRLESYQRELDGLVVESTYNWYSLVDGLLEEG